MIERIKIPKGKVGYFHLGHEPYWTQFPGLKAQLGKYADQLKEKLEASGEAEIIDGGMVDTAQKAREVGDYFCAQGVDLLFCYVTTYATGAVLLPVVQRAGVDVVLLGLQPNSRMDCTVSTTYDQLCHDNVTSLPELCNTLLRARITPLGVLVGTAQGDERVDRELAEWLKVATVKRNVQNARIGLLGHVYEGMLDMHSDPTMFHAAWGTHIQMLELCDLKEAVDSVTDAEIAAKMDVIKSTFVLAKPSHDPIAGPIAAEDLQWSAKVACGLEKLIDAFKLDGMAYYYKGRGEYEKLIAGMIIGNSILTGRGIPMAGELDLKTCLAMLILDRLGIGGSFCELHPVDFEDDIVLVGHDGPAHIRISDAKPIIRKLKLFHGKRGAGLSVEFKVRTGPVTLLGITQTANGSFKFVAAKGESQKGEIPRSGNTNTRVRFDTDVATFIEKWSLEGPTHHFALGAGDAVSVIEKVAKALKTELVVIN